MTIAGRGRRSIVDHKERLSLNGGNARGAQIVNSTARNIHLVRTAQVAGEAFGYQAPHEGAGASPGLGPARARFASPGVRGDGGLSRPVGRAAAPRLGRIARTEAYSAAFLRAGAFLAAGFFAAAFLVDAAFFAAPPRCPCRPCGSAGRAPLALAPPEARLALRSPTASSRSRIRRHLARQGGVDGAVGDIGAVAAGFDDDAWPLAGSSPRGRPGSERGRCRRRRSPWRRSGRWRGCRRPRARRRRGRAWRRSCRAARKGRNGRYWPGSAVLFPDAVPPRAARREASRPCRVHR